MKRKFIELEKIFVKHISAKHLMSRIYIELLQLNNIQVTQFKK